MEFYPLGKMKLEAKQRGFCIDRYAKSLVNPFNNCRRWGYGYPPKLVKNLDDDMRCLETTMLNIIRETREDFWEGLAKMALRTAPILPQPSPDVMMEDRDDDEPIVFLNAPFVGKWKDRYAGDEKMIGLFQKH